jgi:hypothetical protein
VFLELEGFEADIGGRQGAANLQGGETELFARLREESDYGVYYNPQAKVAHKVFEYRTSLRWLLDRAFWQGYSKRGMEQFVPESNSEESDFLAALLSGHIPSRLGQIVERPSLAKVVQLVMLAVFTGIVGSGYLYGAVKWRNV